VQAHHEHHDGSGYPGEVAGDDIPLLGRILAVADAYSAMTLDRPFRKSLTREQARTELLKVAGTQLNPELVRRFVGVLDAQDAEPVAARAEAS
jgi:HD-GYP domain-containing protein (c-di-GMP phosphodiesterase class II)